MDIASEVPHPRRRAARSRAFKRSIRLLCTLLALCTLALGIGVLWQMRSDAWNQAVQSANNLSVTLSDEIGRTIAVYDLSLQGAAEGVALPGIQQATSAVRRSAMFDRAAAAPYLNSILVIDTKGDLVAEARSPDTKKLNFADRDYFRAQRDNPHLGLRVARAIVSRLNPGEPIMELSRRIPTTDGHFAGIISGGLRLGYFHDLFNKLKLGIHGSITLVHMDGRVVYRFPAPYTIDQDVSTSPVFGRYSKAQAGHFVDAGQLDHITRLYAFQRIKGLPLTISVGVSLDDIYAAWWPKAIAISLMLLLLCGVILLLEIWVEREMRRRREVERELEELAQTDGLTGLLNRRGFELAMRREWLHAVRTKEPLSILVLDADNFKRYNDRYGHHAGDGALLLVANAIRKNLRRPRDAGGRFGGEEFVVLLPNTDELAALAIAEKIRQFILDCRLEHVDGPAGYLTVSIGTASVQPEAGLDTDTLFNAADEALYVAKEEGRNLVRPGKRLSRRSGIESAA
ncbi:MAG TPA: sensor domain-containing diguanylate cyclase [Stellaceae bacterium]|nr:sensor domain-containing diguanylate cyclase [Stellaceae bacterium]